MPKVKRQLEIIVDTREQRPWTWRPEIAAGEVSLHHEALETGDYSLVGMKELVTIERKSLADLWGCVGGHRERFKKQFERLQHIRWPALVVEGSLYQIGGHRSRAHSCDNRKVLSSHVIGTLTSWGLRYNVQIWLAGSPRESERLAFYWLRNARRIREEELEA